MEKDNLINETHIKNNTQKYKINKGFLCIFILLIVSISLQSLMFYNLIMFEKILSEKIQTVNISHINDYINKIETIVDYVCNLYIEC